MNNNYLKFFLSVTFCLNLFLGYYFVYNFFFKKPDKVDDNTELQNLINQKEIKIAELDKINKEKQIVIDSLLTKNNEDEKITSTLKQKINQNKKDESKITTPKTRINNSDDAELISELSAEEY